MTAATEPAARGTSDTTPDTRPPAPQPPAALILDAAADFIGQHGWTQGCACDYYTGGVCLEYAVYRAGYQLGASTADVDQILDPIAGRLGMPVALWNDAPGRTRHEVVALLRACADEARTA